MAKILFSFTNDFFIKNQLINGSINDLKKKNDCYFIADRKKVSIYSEDLEKEKNFLGYYNLDENLIKKYRRFFWIRLFKNKIDSKGLELKKKKYLKLKLNWGDESLSQKIIFYPLRFLSFVKRNIFYFFSKFINEEKYTNFFYKKNQIDKKIFEFVKNLNPDLGIYFAQGENHGFIEFVRACKKLNIKTMQIIENWDNLSAKNISNPGPDFLVTLSEQQKKIAEKVHKFSNDKIFVLGSKKYDNFFKLRNSNYQLDIKSKYILFLEGWVWTDQEKMFDVLDKFISQEKILDGIKILYRPHPLRNENYNLVNLKRYKNIILDPQMKYAYENNYFNLKSIPNEEYYASLIKNAEMIICGPTSMILESLILEKKILVLAFKSKDYYSNYNFIKNMINYDYLKFIPSIKINYSLNDIQNDIVEIYKQNYNSDKKEIDKCLEFLIHNSELSHSERFNDLIKKLT